MKKHLFPVLSTLFLMIFTSYVLADTFLIPRTYQQPETAQTVLSVSAEESAAREAAVTDNSYQDDTLAISLETLRYEETDVHIASIEIKEPERLKTALAQNTYGKNITAAASSIAEDNTAILAIDGDFYGAQERGYVVRNGILYRDIPAGREDLVIFGDGSIQMINESEISAAQLLEDGAVQILSFGPALVENGKISVEAGDEVGKAMASNPRTAIGWIDETHMVMVVSDGRTTENKGLSLLQLAELLQSLGVDSAYNLDGGGSSTMVFMGRVVNQPTTNGKIKERSVSHIVYLS